jgi:hypothetical protein
MSIFIFSPKDPQETVLYTFDFRNLMQGSETLQSSVWSIAVVSGTDLNPNAMLTTPILTQTTSAMLITGGISAVTYQITVTANTSNGQVLKMTGQLEVLTQ